MQRGPLFEAQAAEVLRSRWWRVAWAELTRWEERLSRDVKTVAGLAALAAGLYGVLQRPVHALFGLMHARDVGRAELPPPTGIASTTVDRVPEPPGPK